MDTRPLWFGRLSILMTSEEKGEAMEGSGSQTAMMIVWVILVLVALGGGVGVYTLLRRRKARRS